MLQEAASRGGMLTTLCEKLAPHTRTELDISHGIVMPGLVPGERPQPRGIHVFTAMQNKRRGWPGRPSPLWRLARP